MSKKSGKKLVIVESPAKAKTLKKYLGKDFEVLASYGHVRDLEPKEGAVDPEYDFAMKYQLIEKNAKHIDTICKAMKKAEALYLATDPDREGEAISWHLYNILRERGLLQDKPVYRIVFHEITKHAIEEALAHPRQLSMELVNAQQARRALDFLVGFNLSPLLWKKIRRGLSAGRVQSPALRLIVEREKEIERFKPREYWTIEADLSKKRDRFGAKLIQYEGHKLSQFSIKNGEQAREMERRIAAAARGELVITRIEKKQRKRNPSPPFITSTLQQEAARKLGFTAQRTMRAAQQLYEGIDIGDGAVGLITYMRTDSVNLAQEALQEIRAYIAERFGKDKLPKHARHFKTKSKNAQEAHEAIRPTQVHLEPDAIKDRLTADQYKLYNLIWKRAVACQMNHATIHTVSVDLAAGDLALFRATGSMVADPGFMAVYQEGTDEQKQKEEERMLPELVEGEHLKLEKLRSEQHFTEPPPRYTEASLIKVLEEYGIGRPSTYASIIATLQQRDYAVLENKRFKPTDVGRIVNKFLTEHFTRYVDYDFTADLEDELDAISRGEKDWIPVLRGFWKPFKKLVNEKEQNVQRKDVTQEPIDEQCPKCGAQLSIRLGRRGRFVGCTAFPECDYTRNLDDDGETVKPETVEGRKCPQCQSDLIVRQGPYGKFIGCSGYPKCRFIEPLEKPSDTGVPCPECGKGSMLQRKSRRGKIFYSCSTYPDCSYAVWNEPLNQPCPQCQWPMLTLKTTKRRGAELVCPQKDCGYTEPYYEEKKKKAS